MGGDGVNRNEKSTSPLLVLLGLIQDDSGQPTSTFERLVTDVRKDRRLKVCTLQTCIS